MLGFKHDLVMFAIRKFDHLIFNGRAISGPQALDLTAVQRRPLHIVADQLVNSWIGTRDVAGNLVLELFVGSK